LRDFLHKKKQPGKGIEDISHFFLSPVNTPEPKTTSSESKHRVIMPVTLHRIIAVISQTPTIPTIFWSSQIASILSHSGKRVLVIDVGTEPEKLGYVLNSVTIHPTLGDLLNQTDKSIAVDVPGGFRVLAFQLQLKELDKFKDEEQEILFQSLRKEEQQADIVLLNIHFDQSNTDLLVHLQTLHEAVVVGSPEDLFGAYRMLKVLFYLRPSLCVGLVEYGTSEGAYRGGVQRLVMASKEFLKTSPVVLGGIGGSASAKANGSHPTFANGSSQEQAMVGICKRILEGLNGEGSRGLFFEHIQARMKAHFVEKGKSV
jgi:hypothetical protein